MMSSMRRFAIFIPLLLATTGSVTAQPAVQPYAPRPAYAPAPAADIDYALADWRRLRQSTGYSFADYARFIVANPGWPGEATLRKSAEKAMRPGESALTVIGFYRTAEPLSGNGWARLAESLSATGKPVEALAAAKSAWGMGDLSAYDEAALFGRFTAGLTAADHDRRVDALLFEKKTTDAYRMLPWASPARRNAFNARIAMLARQPDADMRYRLVAAQTATDAGLLMDRARYLREMNDEAGARQLMARPHSFSERPANVERFYDMLIVLARGAMADRQYQTAYDIARQVDDSYAPGADLTLKSYAVRDDYTTLTWTAALAAYERINRPRDAVVLFDKYARGGRSLQVATKGWYWAGRAAAQSGDPVSARAHFERAAATPELFYGQLALERLGRPVPAPAAMPSLSLTEPQRQAFQQKRLVRATRLLGSQGRRDEQSLFIRALSENVTTDPDRLLATDFASAIGRQDLAVWTGRSARNAGSAFYYRAAYPVHSSSVPGGRSWSLVHGITRQESSFDRSAVSHAGACGLMQLMPGTAKLVAPKLGLAYDIGRLTSDPDYNVALGSAYLGQLRAEFGSSPLLIAAGYNAGPGRPRGWIKAFGDPRQLGIDPVDWIENVPFTETRTYIMRVTESMLIYRARLAGKPVPIRLMAEMKGQ